MRLDRNPEIAEAVVHSMVDIKTSGEKKKTFLTLVCQMRSKGSAEDNVTEAGRLEDHPSRYGQSRLFGFNRKRRIYLQLTVSH